MTAAHHTTLAQAKAAGRPSDRGRFLRINDLIATIGLSRSTIYREVAKGALPAPVRLTQRAIGWWESDVQAALEQRRQPPG